MAGGIARSHESRDPETSEAPPLRPFGLRLHHDASWTHEGAPIAHRRLRERLDRAVRYLPEEAKYAVQIGRFRGEIEVEEAGFFVRGFDPSSGEIQLSDRSVEPLDVSSLELSGIDGALLCRVKRDLAAEGLLARFSHAAQADFMNAVDESGAAVRLGGELCPLPEL